MDRKRTSIYEIAKEAGVSPATVSRVINQSAKVSEDKRQRVLKVIDQYGFKPNALAKGLSNSRSRVLGILSAWVDSPFYGRVISECERATNERDYTLMIFSFSSDAEQERRHLEKMYEQCVDAVIILGGSMDGIVIDEKAISIMNYIAETVPVVVMGRSQGIPCYEVRIDEAGAMEMAMEYLIGLGHRDIAFLGGLENIYSSLEKRLAYQRVLRKYGLEFREEWMRCGDYNFEDGLRLMKKVLEGERPTAVICINDAVAQGAIRAIADKGLRVPEDISVVSCDQFPSGEYSCPRLTTLDQQNSYLGRMSIMTLISAIHSDSECITISHEPRLIIRESCGARLGYRFEE